MSPPPRAIDDSRLGSGSPVTTTTCGSLPRRFRMRLSASEREFCDRSQNSRSEALNLIRNRRGKLPHVVVVTGEPLPSRLSSIALGGGDIDCVYHFALPELRETVEELRLSDSEEALNIMINGKRLKDISDLPLDLAV